MEGIGVKGDYNMSNTCYLLISVYEREILTEQFSTLRSANAAMKEEMIRNSDSEVRCFVEELVGDTDNWKTEYDDGSFGFGVYEGYMNDDVGRRQADWHIAPVSV